MSSHIFREYGIRGVATRDLPDPLVVDMGRGLAELLRPEGHVRSRVVVSRDCRASSPRLFGALCHGLTTGGADVIDVGLGPTPQLYFATQYLAADGGIMITGGGHRAEYNGLQIIGSTGHFERAKLRDLEGKVAGGPLRAADRSGCLTEQFVAENYLNAVSRGFDINAGPMQFVVDAGNGAAGPLGCEALRRGGVEPVALHCAMDGAFPNRSPDPTEPEALHALIAKVRQTGAIIGLAWDGGGERLAVVDDNGTVVKSRHLLALLARHTPRTPGADGKMLRNGSSAQTFAQTGFAQTGFAQTGFAHINAAAESNGRFVFWDRYFGFADAIYAALRVIEIITQSGKGMTELVRELPKCHSLPEVRLDCPNDRKLDVIAELKRQLMSHGETIGDISGVGITYPDGSFGWVRASNTKPQLVLRFEAPNDERVAELSALTQAIVSRLCTRTEQA